MVHLNVHGDAFVGKYRADGEIVQLGLHPARTASRSSCAGSGSSTRSTPSTGRTEHGPEDILHIKGM